MVNNRSFYSADKAFEMTTANKVERENKWLEEIFNEIDIHVNCGVYECRFVKLNDFQWKWLESNGYKVSVIKNPETYTDGMINVSWEQR